MPTATTTKSLMTGTKRKSAPAKDQNAKESKKPKIVSAPKSTMKSKSQVKSKPVLEKKVEVFSDSDSEDLDSGGGVPLDLESEGSDDVEENEENLPKAADGLHPERAKAVVANSESHWISWTAVRLIIYQVSPQKKHMPNRSNWRKKEKLRNR